VAPKGESKKSLLSAWIENRGDRPIDLPALDDIRATLGKISESYLRKLLKESGAAMTPLVEGVSQESFEQLERTLLALAKEYEDPAKKLAARRTVITAKDHARFAARRASDEAYRQSKEEMTLWMLTWLENPNLFEAWVPLRKRLTEFRWNRP
jgi:hypothetical protein